MATLLHVDLVVRDLDASVRFYTELFGCVVVEDAIVEGALPEFYTRGATSSVRVVLLKASPAMFGVMIELMHFEPGAAGCPVAPRVDGELPSICNLTFLVDDLTEITTKLERAGVGLASPRLDLRLPKTGSVTLLFLRDPDGNLLELVERRRPDGVG